MPYSIVYGMEKEQKHSRKSRRRIVLTASMFLIFLWCVISYWKDGREVLKLLLIPGDAGSMIHAAEVFAQELSSGFSVVDALENFFGTVFAHGYSG